MLLAATSDYFRTLIESWTRQDKVLSITVDADDMQAALLMLEYMVSPHANMVHMRRVNLVLLRSSCMQHVHMCGADAHMHPFVNPSLHCFPAI